MALLLTLIASMVLMTRTAKICMMIKPITALDHSKISIPRGSRINGDKNIAIKNKITKPIVKILKSKAAYINFENPLIRSLKFLYILQYVFVLPSNNIILYPHLFTCFAICISSKILALTDS